MNCILVSLAESDSLKIQYSRFKNDYSDVITLRIFFSLLMILINLINYTDVTYF